MKKIIQEDKRILYCMITSFITGVICYGYCLCNNLVNYDSSTNTPIGIGGTVGLGRWMLEIMGILQSKLFGLFHLRYLWGVIAIFIYAVSAYIIIISFDIKKTLTCIAISAITVAFPAVGSSMFFSYCVHLYAVGFLFAVLSVLYVLKEKIGYYLVAVLLIAGAIGTYQSFFPVTASLLVSVLIMRCFRGDTDQLITKAIKYGLCLIGGYAVNFLVSKIALVWRNTSLVDYRGISTMGNLTIDVLPSRVIYIYKAFLFPFISKGLMGVTNPILNKGLLLLLYLTLWAGFVYLFLRTEKPKKKFFLGIAIYVLILPLSTMALYLILPVEEIYTLMMSPLLIMFYLPCFLFDKEEMEIKKIDFASIVCCSIILISLNYACMENLNYNAQYYSNRKAENYFTMMFAQIRATEGYTADKQITFIGNYINDPSIQEEWDLGSYVMGGNCLTHEQLNVYSRQYFVKNFLGLSYSSITDEQSAKYKEIIEAMPSYPDYGSIVAIDDCVLVRVE